MTRFLNGTSRVFAEYGANKLKNEKETSDRRMLDTSLFK